jgi:diguanylate cyclase (GGDEF)-like protein
MRIVRRASLIFSVVLIVAIAVGFFTRTGELERARDLRLSAAAEVAASELAARVDTATVAASTGGEPSDVAAALASVLPDHGICVISADTTACAGDGPTPSDALVHEQERARRIDADGPARQGGRVTVYDRRVTIAAEGSALSVLVEVPVHPNATVWPTTYLPSGAAGNEYVDDGNTRQTAVAVPGAVGVYMVAAAERAVALPDAEHRFYVIVFTLAVVLLVLAGVTLVVEHRSLVERASFDRLTQLPNRSEFERSAGDVFSGGAEGACLLLFDLDGFKEVNDTYGHHAGDQVLQVIARRLRSSVRDGDVVARWGGDEFVVLLPGVTSAEMGARRARQLAEEVAGRTRIDGVGESLRIRTSVGVALWPQHGRDLHDLVVAADQAMYEAKRSGTVTHVSSVDDEASEGPLASFGPGSASPPTGTRASTLAR